jgi:hypothetical protein
MNFAIGCSESVRDSFFVGLPALSSPHQSLFSEFQRTSKNCRTHASVGLADSDALDCEVEGETEANLEGASWLEISREGIRCSRLNRTGDGLSSKRDGIRCSRLNRFGD